MDKKPSLTIMIPTYNRNEKLLLTVERLLPQLSSDAKLVIVDNCSDIPVRETLNHIDFDNVKIVRNDVNVGISANFIKCFEECDTEWLWLLGDDDPPLLNSVETILADVREYESYSYINYNNRYGVNRKTLFSTTGLESFIDKIDDFGNILFISVGVFNISKLTSNKRFVNQLSYSLAPHILYLLTGLNENSKVLFTPTELHDFSLRNTTPEESWSWLSLSLSTPILYEVPLRLTEKAKKRFADLILTHVKSPKSIFSIIEQPSTVNMPLHEKRYLLRQIYFRSLLFKGLDKSFFSWLWYDIKLCLKHALLKREAVYNEERHKRL